MKIDYSLKDALSWRFVVVSILPLLILSIVSFDFFTRETEYRLARENRSTAESIAAQISLELQEPQAVVHEIGRFCKYFSQSETHCNDYLDEVVKDSNSIDSVFLLDEQRHVVSAGLPEDVRHTPFDYVGLDLSLLPQVRHAGEGQDVTWSKAFFSQQQGKISIALTSRIDCGLIVAYVNIEQLQQRFLPMPGDQPAQLLLLDSHGQLILQFPQAAAPNLVDLGHLSPVEATQEGAPRPVYYELKG